MLSNQVQLKQSVNEPKRDTSVNNSTANSDDRKFEDAMHYSRQQQLMAEQRQQAARSDQARQQQRRETEQLQTRRQQSNQQSSNQQEQSSVERNSTQQKNDVGHTNKTSVSDKANEQAAEANDDTTQEQTSFSSEHQQDETSASAQTKTLSSNEALEQESTPDKAASTSWLDTVMKIVEGQEQDISENIELSDAKSNAQTDVLGINLQQKTTTEHATGYDTDKVFSELNKAGKQSSTNTELSSNESLESSSKLSEAEKQLANLTRLLAEQVDNAESKMGDNIELEADEGSLKASSGLETEPNTTAKAVSEALGLSDKNLSKDDAGLDEAAQKAQVLASIQQLQAQQNQTSASKVDSLLANTKPVNTVLNFANPNLQGLIKTNQSQEGANLTFDLDGELSDEQLNGIESGKSNERNLDTQLKSLLEARSSLLMTSAQDIPQKANEAGLKDVVDVNGVQLDKNLQLPKLEHISQNKSETLLRENILFNKQELANHMQQQIGLMMSKNMKSIDIRLDPPELGAMQIKLSMNNEQASVSFVVSNQQAKDALDASLPKLREMLEQEGMDLAESDVQQGNSNNADADSDDNQDRDNNGRSMANDDGQDDANLIAQDKLNRAINSPWNVDYYA